MARSGPASTEGARSISLLWRPHLAARVAVSPAVPRPPADSAVPEDRAERAGRALGVRMLDGVTERERARELWTALERELGGAPSLTCSWAWTETWLDHFGAAVPHRFAVALAGDGAPLAIALLTRAPTRFPRPRAWHLGTAGEPAGASVFVERNRLLARPAERAAFAAALVARLRSERGWERLRLDGLHADDARDLLDALGGPSDAVETTVEESPVAELQIGDDVLAGLSGSRRQRIRRSLRALGELETEWATTAAEGAAILDELIELHERRWQEAGAPGAFAHPAYVAFHRALVARLLPQEGVALARVRRAGDRVTVGCLYGLRDGDRLCFYQGGLQRYDDNRLRAGVGAHVAFMRACRERGLARYDFLAPATRYKVELSSATETLTWIEARRGGWRLRLSDATRALRAKR